MMETPLRFGPGARLCGMLATANTTDTRDSPAVVFITAGLLHKPGPYRLYADLARVLAPAGFASLRFDLSGIGESRSRPGNESAEHTAVADVRDAIDALVAETGCTRVVLAGLCSGAEVAHRAALADARVCGIIALDGYIVRTPAFYFWHYLPRIVSLRKWAGFIAAKFRRLRDRALAPQRSADDDALAFWAGPGPDREQLVREFDALCRRGVWQLQIFSGGSGDCSYENQFHDAFGEASFRGLIDVRFHADADHMYVLNADRRMLTRAIARWMQERFSEAAPPVPVHHLRTLERPAALNLPDNKQGSATIAARRNLE